MMDKNRASANIQLSVAIITFNEEKNIERCILSVQDVADEIIVVDSFSKDKTQAICEKYNVNFMHHPFEGYAEQKNYALNKTSFPYVLSLDADEALSDELKASIQEVKKNFDADGYSFNRLSNYCGKWIKHSGWYPDAKLRIWKKGSGEWGGGDIHEKVLLKNNSKVKHIQGDLLHYTCYSIQQHMMQINKYSDLKANQAFKKGKKSSVIKLLLSPLVKFIRHYFFKLGFLDGFFGFVICINSAHSTFLKYAKLKELHFHKKNLSEL